MQNSPDLGSDRSRFVIRAAAEPDVPAIRAFLEVHLDTSIFLLWGLTTQGLTATSSPVSGNFRLIEEAGQLAGVACLTRKGDLLAQSGGRPEMAGAILEDCARESRPVVSVLAELPLADALWRQLNERPGIRAIYNGRNLVYRLSIVPVELATASGVSTRRLTADDYPVWSEVDRAFLESEGLTVIPDEARRLSGYRLRADVDAWWGVFDGPTLVATACLNAEYEGAGQVGGVYTRPAWRRRGYARLAMHALMRHHAARGLREVVLFTAESNAAAKAMYQSMGFEPRGRFGMFFGQEDPARIP